MFDKMASNGKQPKSVSIPKTIDKLWCYLDHILNVCRYFCAKPLCTYHEVLIFWLCPWYLAADL